MHGSTSDYDMKRIGAVRCVVDGGSPCRACFARNYSHESKPQHSLVQGAEGSRSFILLLMKQGNQKRILAHKQKNRTEATVSASFMQQPRSHRYSCRPVISLTWCILQQYWLIRSRAIPSAGVSEIIIIKSVHKALTPEEGQPLACTPPGRSKQNSDKTEPMPSWQ